MVFQFQLRATGGVAVAAISAAGLTTRWHWKKRRLQTDEGQDKKKDRDGKEDELRVHHFLGNVEDGRGSNSLVL